MRISRPNRRRQQDAKGRKKRPMPMDGASVRNIQRMLGERAEGKRPINRPKKRRKKRS